MVTRENVRRFDFKKKPHKPYFLMYAAKYIISFPDLKKRKAVIRKHGMEKIPCRAFFISKFLSLTSH